MCLTQSNNLNIVYLRARANKIYSGNNDEANDCLGLAREGREGQFGKATDIKYRLWISSS